MPSALQVKGRRRKVLLNERAGHPDRSMDTWVTWPDYSYKIPITELIPKVRVQKNSCLIEVYTFQVIVRFLCSDNVSRRCSCLETIGALSGVVLLFLNARPVVSDERSEEFRRSVKESLTGPFQANRSDGIKPGIGIERKNKIYVKARLIFLGIFSK